MSPFIRIARLLAPVGLSLLGTHGASAQVTPLARIDSLILAGEFDEAVRWTDSLQRKVEERDPAWVELQIRRLGVMRHIDQGDLLLFLSRDLLELPDLTQEQVQRIRLLRAVALENVALYPEAGKELDTLERTFPAGTVGRAYGEYLYRRASLLRVQEREEEALEWARKAIAYNETHGHTKELATSLMVMAYLTPRGPEFEALLLHAAELNVAAGDPLEASLTYGRLSIELAKRRSPLTERYIRLTLTLAEKVGTSISAFADQQVSRSYAALGETDSAYHYLVAFVRHQSEATHIKQNASVRVNEAQRAYAQLERSQATEEEAVRNSTRLKSLVAALASAVFAIAFLLVLLRRQYLRIRRQRDELAARQQELNRLLGVKETLLRELHHRVKNQLSTVIAMIDHELDREVPPTQEQLRSLQQRIFAIARVHEALLQDVEAHGHLNGEDLAEILRSLIAIAGGAVQLDLDARIDRLSMDVAVPLMMLLNELVQNTVKHTRSTEPRITLRLEQDDGSLQVDYRDNGSWKEEVESVRGSSGTYIIRAMVKQLHGRMERTGTAYVFHFPRPGSERTNA
ncbi:MAG: histidine kinase dimerization/phosphoacceptor domain -containing protein [Flavobacteriales bacterium]